MAQNALFEFDAKSPKDETLSPVRYISNIGKVTVL